MVKEARNALGSRGFTITELMVSVGLTGVLSLAMMTMFTDNAKKITSARNDSALSDDVMEFNDALETFLTNTTAVFSCMCRNDNATARLKCSFLETVPANCMGDGVPGGGHCGAANNVGGRNFYDLLVFETESASNPGESAAGQGAGCMFGGAVSATVPATSAPSGTMMLRGCKRKMVLRFYEPTRASAAGLGTNSEPGMLSLEVVSNPALPPSTVVAGGLNSTAVMRLPGVYYVDCGFIRQRGLMNMDKTAGGVQAKSSETFRLSFQVKARRNNASIRSGANNYESWHPRQDRQDDAAQPYRFRQGTHRFLTMDINFRNISSRGIMFGKPYTIVGCTRDGSFSPTGDCCSGYTSSTGICVPVSGCVPRDGTSNEVASCCSHIYSAKDAADQCL